MDVISAQDLIVLRAIRMQVHFRDISGKQAKAHSLLLTIRVDDQVHLVNKQQQQLSEISRFNTKDKFTYR